MRSCSSSAAATTFKLPAASVATGREGGRCRGGLCGHRSDFRDQLGSLSFQGLDCGRRSTRGNLCRLVLLRRNPICSVASSSSPSPESQVELDPTEDDDPRLLDKGDSRMARIKMQLQKECQFGEQFLLVGAHPTLGLWNPLDAVPMTWSDGHVWTAELEIPLGEPVQFKFILRKMTGEVLWQSGQDRILHTWETSNIISVFEDWENAEAQQVTEERVVHNKYEESDESMTDEIKQLKQTHGEYSEEQEPQVESYEASDYAHSVAHLSDQTAAIVADNITDSDMNRVGKPSMASEDRSFEREKDPFPIVADTVTSKMERTVEISGNQVAAENNISHTINNAVGISDKGLMTSENSLETKETPVLVPGLHPCSTASNEDVTAEEEPEEVEISGNQVAAENIISHTIKNAVGISDKGLMTSENSLETEETPVLLPGLNPCSTASNEDVSAEEELEEVELDISNEGGSAEHEVPVIQLDRKLEDIEPHLEKEEATSSLIFNNEHASIIHPSEFNDDEEADDKPDQDIESDLTERQNDTESSPWGNDLKWGQETLKRILNTLGFH